jgi:hypothetical protein
MRESAIEKYLARHVILMGGEIRKAQWMLPGRTPFWVELKATGEKPTAQQVREHNRMRRLGELVYVIDSIEDVIDLLNPQEG